jgi:hypothetical protein
MAKWTTEVPTGDGYYWLRGYEAETQIVRIGEDGIYQTGWELAIQPDDLQEHGAEFWDEPVIAPGPPWQYKLEYDDGRIEYIPIKEFDTFLTLKGENPGVDFMTRLHQLQSHVGRKMGRIIDWKEENF